MVVNTNEIHVQQITNSWGHYPPLEVSPMTQLTHYTPSDPARWTGRVDDLEDRDAFRWHQVIERFDLSAPTDQLPLQAPRGFCLLGYCCDQGAEMERACGRGCVTPDVAGCAHEE